MKRLSTFYFIGFIAIFQLLYRLLGALLFVYHIHSMNMHSNTIFLSFFLVLVRFFVSLSLFIISRLSVLVISIIRSRIKCTHYVLYFRNTSKMIAYSILFVVCVLCITKDLSYSLHFSFPCTLLT